MPTRVKAFQMLDPLEPNYRRPGLREIVELQGATSGLPAGTDIDRSVAEWRDRLLQTLEQTTLEGSTQTVLEKLWSDATTASNPKSNFTARTAAVFLAIVIRALIERERDKHYTALTAAQRLNAKMRSVLQARTDEFANESRHALCASESRPTWIQNSDSFILYLADRFTGLESS